MQPAVTEAPARHTGPPPTPPWLDRWMTRLLRSPFSGLVDRGIMLLTVTGTTTGRRYTFPVQYVRDGDTLWVMTGGSDEKRWWRNLRSPSVVEVFLRRRTFSGIGRAFAPQTDHDDVVAGIRRYAARFPSMAKRLGIVDDDPASLERIVARTAIVRITLD